VSGRAKRSYADSLQGSREHKSKRGEKSGTRTATVARGRQPQPGFQRGESPEERKARIRRITGR
jgi:hypothetical protein